MTGYSGGRIKRIRMRNFMTYDDVEIYPEKGLNLVVGLNGSGKSSIMCAICLGLAGKPHFTGRATQVSDFIKHGQQEAVIEIELESANKRNVVIHRKMIGDKCEWTLNNSPSSQNQVIAAVKKFNIDTSNLCQFLPQEKVVEFSRMDKKQRLENMLQAIGEPHLFKLFNELKDLYKQVTELQHTVKKHENTKYDAEEENDRISDEVQKQENRVRLKKELEDLDKQKTIVMYQDAREEANDLKEKVKELQKEAELLSKERDEATAQEDVIFNSYQTCYKRFQQLGSQKKNIKGKMTNKTNALINFKEQVETVKIEYRNKLREKEDQKKRLLDLNKQIEGLKVMLEEELLKKGKYDEEEQLKSRDLAQLQTEINELYQNVEKIAAEKNQIDYNLISLRNQLNSLQNEQNKKMANLKKVCKSTHQAACWLLDNRHRFKSNVYLPIMLEININSQSNAKYIENVIGFRDMIAFVCEDKSDCERLTEIFKKQQNLPVNIVMAPDTPMSNYTSPILSREHRQCGLECFVKDLFTAPEPIMKYLCACCRIHRIPVASTVVPGNAVEFVLQSYSVFFSENMMVNGRRSRYGNRNWSVKKDFIMDKNLLVNTNDELQREVEQKCQIKEQQLEDMKRELDSFNTRLAEKEKKQEKLRQEKKFLQDKKKSIENLKANYLQKTQYQKQLTPVSNEEEEKQRMTTKIKSINDLRGKVLKDLGVLFEEFATVEKEIVFLILCMNMHSRDLKLARSANEDIHDKVKAVKSQHETIRKKYVERKTAALALLDEIKTMGQLFPLRLSLEDIEQKINHIQAQLNLNEDNELLVNEYNKRKRKIEAIQEKIRNYEQNVKENKEEIQKKKKEWLPPLQHHISNINRKFSHYFKELGCAGEISLDIPDENPDDFTKYGLRINLKFHDEESSLCELSQTRHSGGECSVAAIVFILSLQELTEVPFRCIDEINQGMDSVNERKIYQLIYDSVADDRCSQYFLLTPKLLMDLDYPENVAVHVIFNSPFLQTNLNVKKHIKIRS